MWNTWKLVLGESAATRWLTKENSQAKAEVEEVAARTVASRSEENILVAVKPLRALWHWKDLDRE